MNKTTPRERACVLIVDDDVLLLRALARVLRRDYEVLTLNSPEEALRRIEAGEEWSAILSDVMMSEMSGPEFARRVTERRPALARRIGFITGGTFTADAREGLERKPFPVLHKPFDLTVLRELVAKLCRG
jgi:CheY-like chemotaxis protein